MKSYTGRRIRIYEYGNNYDKMGNIERVRTGKEGRLLEIDVHNEHVMVYDDDGNLLKLNYKLVRLV